MRRYLAQRVMSAGLVLVGVSFVVFLALHLAPGDPAQILLGPMATPKDLGALREQLGLDKPVLVQYGRWASQVAQGDFGRSIMLRRAVLPEVWRRFHATLILAGAALLLAFPLGVLMGVLSAARRGSRLDRLCQLVALVGVSMPAFWVGLLLVIGFSVRLGWLPGTGMYRPTGDGELADLLAHLILPAVTLSLVPLAVVSRVTRSSMLDVIAQDYVRTARAKGASETRVIAWHAFRNTLVSLVTVLGLEVGYLLAGAVYVETVFSWPGVGFMMVNAILTRDFPLVQGGVLLVAAIYVAVNLVTDILYVWVDPRVRYGG
jgi:ABC-type dipeptide/oligopeptide/nickel transport system permease component